MLLFVFQNSIAQAQGNALHFDGNNDNVSINNTLGNFGTGNFTLECWVNTNATTNVTILTKRSGITYSNFFRLLVLSSGKAIFEIDQSSAADYTSITGGTNINDGRWHHVAVVRVATQLLLYVDGKSDATPVTIAGNPNISNSFPFTLGAYYTGSVYTDYYKGMLDEVRIYNTNLSLANIQADMFSVTSSVPVSQLAYYNFDHGTAGGSNAGITTLTNQAGAGHNGTLNNFALTTGNTSNWVESYAMVVPTASAATNHFGTGFTAHWSAPATGTVDNGYRLDVSTSNTFSSFVTGYNALTVNDTSYAVTGLAPNTSYYYRVRADKTSTTGQGGNSSTITASTLALSTDATLSALTSTAGTFSPVFNPATTAYSITVPNVTNAITVTPTVNDPHATVQVEINGGGYSTATSGSPTSALNLNTGSNTINIKVTAEDGSTTKTYALTINRMFVGNALHFDGSNDYVALNTGGATAVNFTSASNFTIETWLNTSST